MRGQALRQASSRPLRQWYDRLLSGTAIADRTVTVPGAGRVHLLEAGVGPPVVMLHGSGLTAGFFLPLLRELHGVRVLAPDLPGAGLSDPVDLPRSRYHDVAVAWLDRLLDALGLDSAAVVGHSGGGVWALRYALAHPSRVNRLVLVGVPTLPGTRCPIPQRLMATPGLGALLSRVPPSQSSALRLARVLGEGDTLAQHPDLVEMFVLAGRDRVSAAAFRAELRALISPYGLLTRSGWRDPGVGPDDLRRLGVPTLVLWGDHDPLGSVRVARSVTELIPQARLQVLPTGHGPWLGEAVATAAAVGDFLR